MLIPVFGSAQLVDLPLICVSVFKGIYVNEQVLMFLISLRNNSILTRSIIIMAVALVTKHVIGNLSLKAKECCKSLISL